MRASERYEFVSAWSETDREVVQSGDWFPRDDDIPVLVIREVADIRDTKSGYVYRQGAYRVRSFRDGRSFKRAKTFYGEMAWADSQRMYDDIRSEVLYA